MMTESMLSGRARSMRDISLPENWKSKSPLDFAPAASKTGLQDETGLQLEDDLGASWSARAPLAHGNLRTDD